MEKVYALSSALDDIPDAGVAIDAADNLYGTTSSGSGYLGNGNGGTVFELVRQANGSWAETVLQSFPSTTNDGIEPLSGVTFDSKGNLFGTTSVGGTQGGGTIFEIAGIGKVVPLIGTVTTLVVTPNMDLVAGEPITLTATVTSVGGATNPTGTVTFTDPAGGSATVPLKAGIAAFTRKVPPPGTYSVYASYSGAVGFTQSASAIVTSTVSPPSPQ